MKKILFVAALMTAGCFMSCGNKTSNVKQNDSTIVDSDSVYCGIDSAYADSIDSLMK